MSLSITCSLFTSGATHVLQWGVQRAATTRVDANPKNLSQFGLESATRLHEAGFASNRASATARWIRSRALYTPPVKPWEPGGVYRALQNIRSSKRGWQAVPGLFWIDCIYKFTQTKKLPGKALQGSFLLISIYDTIWRNRNGESIIYVSLLLILLKSHKYFLIVASIFWSDMANSSYMFSHDNYN